MCLSTIDIKANKARCLELLRSTGREGMEDMIVELEKMGYFTAPASSYYHLNVEGGLVQHSLNVYDAAMVVWEGMKQFRPKLGTSSSQLFFMISASVTSIRRTQSRRGDCLISVRRQATTLLPTTTFRWDTGRNPSSLHWLAALRCTTLRWLPSDGIWVRGGSIRMTMRRSSATRQLRINSRW